jgi:hypothetical protein
VKRLSITVAILFMVFTMACKESSEIPASDGSGSNSGMTQSVPASPQPSTVSSAPLDNPNGASTQSATAPGMNPPHGQPNHRCDIPVGTPLNSPPGTQPTTPASMQPIVPAQTAAPSTAPGMNPPHGQPNHRCDIPVGTPLNSPAVTPK